MSDPDPASKPNRPSRKPHRQGGDGGDRGRQGVESRRQRGQVIDGRGENTLSAYSQKTDQEDPPSKDQ